MAFRRTPLRTRPANAADLEATLEAEFRNPSDHPEPLIIAPGEGPITQLYVVWSDWEGLSAQDRSEIIMNAYMRAKGETDALRVSVAMGLTRPEAQRLGIPLAA